jgi:hypothetical protein
MEELTQDMDNKVNLILQALRYPADRNSEYGLPIDEKELDRIDMSHAKYYILLDKKRFLAPIKNPQKVLDLGCGTGLTSLPSRSLDFLY